MRGIPLFDRPVLRLLLLGALALPLSAQAQAQAPAPNGTTGASAATATQACEREARQALAGRGVQPAEVTFSGAPAVQHSLSNESQVVLRGVARWRLASDVRSINYSCTVDRQTLEVGLVMRDTTAAPAQAAPARAPAEPDLSALSPAACESSAAEALKRRWPRVSQITFDPATRRFRQQSGSRAELQGGGRAVPEPGSPATFFGFDCEIDPRDGRVLRTSLSS